MYFWCGCWIVDECDPCFADGWLLRFDLGVVSIGTAHVALDGSCLSARGAPLFTTLHLCSSKAFNTR